MKKLKKIMFASVAFLFAVVAAFASKNVSSTDSIDQYYAKDGAECVATDCSPSNQGESCNFIVYEEDISNECSTPVTVSTYRLE
ncbi:DUF6520 family protein [Confluentibacter flavum]|uniref:Secreted protein n=1 Tax=Confluentibacter flavum TaxID=1909700 RepID=A0A2N3HGW2_9FLAO|nr:DUF6520 family protein [Confluentibacter flavum]PKQ44219.1 hypothetical protein CSW08_14040 [Confluentibacter flavum]